MLLEKSPPRKHLPFPTLALKEGSWGVNTQLLTSFPPTLPMKPHFIHPFDRHIRSFFYMPDIVLSVGSKTEAHSNSNNQQLPLPTPASNKQTNKQKNLSHGSSLQNPLAVTTQSDCAKIGVRTGCWRGTTWGQLPNGVSGRGGSI